MARIDEECPSSEAHNDPTRPAGGGLDSHEAYIFEELVPETFLHVLVLFVPLVCRMIWHCGCEKGIGGGNGMRRCRP
jgi:hypothetical protein